MRRRGFTLIEILVVISIIGVLAAIILPALAHVMESSKVSSCSNEIRQLEAALASYESVHRDYPPSRLSEIGIAGNRTNEGNESLLVCLTTEKEGPFWEIREDQLGNSDGDQAPRLISTYNGSTIRTRDLYELLDPWGNPYVYVHAKDLATGYSVTYMAEGRTQPVEPVRQGEKAGITPGEGKYQIWSFGPNGVNDQGAEDDVVSWRGR